MKRYRFSNRDGWIEKAPTIEHEDPFMAFWWGCGDFCYVYEEQELIAVIDCTGWRVKRRGSNRQHKEALVHYLQTRLDEIVDHLEKSNGDQ